MVDNSDGDDENSYCIVIPRQKVDLRVYWTSSVPAKISFNIILLNLAVRIITIFLLIDLFIFSS